MYLTCYKCKLNYVYICNLKQRWMNTEQILKDYSRYKETRLHGRYITLKDIESLITELADFCTVELIGTSENKLPIHLIKLGTGKKPLLFWSQMHGNESTTTKALFDLLHLLKDPDNVLGRQILAECTLYIVPMLNPDGAEAYTRVNFNKVDLNRDAQDRSQAESVVFKKIVDRVRPLVAFNLHGQRTIFSAGETNKSAIVSFLSPASDAERTITDSRKKGMRIIAEMNKALQTVIPDCVGRYDDGFNINCTGDTMEDAGYTTILFEAGHHPKDYDREITRKWMYLSLVTALDFLANNELTNNDHEKYFDIPENGKRFKDIIVRNVDVEGEKKDVSIQYVETLINQELTFVPKIVQIDTQITDFGHIEFDSRIEKVNFSNVLENAKISDELKYLSINNEIFSVFPIKK